MNFVDISNSVFKIEINFTIEQTGKELYNLTYNFLNNNKTEVFNFDIVLQEYSFIFSSQLVDRKYANFRELMLVYVYRYIEFINLFLKGRIRKHLISSYVFLIEQMKMDSVVLRVYDDYME